MLNYSVVGLGGAILLILFGAREVIRNPPAFRLFCVTVAYVLTSSVLNNQCSIALRGTVSSNKFLDSKRYV